MEETHVCLIHKHDFQILVRNHPDIALKVMEEGCRLTASKILLNNGTRTVEARFFSIEFADKYGVYPEGIMIELPLNRKGIANHMVLPGKL